MNAVYRFPRGFLWGAATSSHQVEGDNRANDWWECEERGALPHRSGEACRHFDLYASDFDLACSMGHNAHRLSIEWSRIEPHPGQFEARAVQHYADVLSALEARGLEPIVTLHHFTNPAWFARRGGWLARDSHDLFCRYVEYVCTRLRGRVRYWLTINEPTVYVMRAFVAGDWPPFQRRAWWRAYRVLRNLCRAHARAYPIIHRCDPQARVGLAHSAPYIVASDPNRRADRLAARVRDFALNELWLRLVGRRALDFIGINYYVRQRIRWQPRGPALLLGTEDKQVAPHEVREFSSLGWEIYPDGLRAVLKRYARLGIPLLVTENGVATAEDRVRADFITAHVRAVAEAMREGADVRGYLYWTLFDNFEWTEGPQVPFGLAAVETASQRRSPRPSAACFEQICRNNAVALGRGSP
jgi:beta-glucosidase